MNFNIIEGLTENEITELFNDSVEISDCYHGTFPNGDACWIYCDGCSYYYVNSDSSWRKNGCYTTYKTGGGGYSCSHTHPSGWRT